METLCLALDWTPNINHIGFFVAREQGFYQAEGLAVEIIDPLADNYATTPAKKVELGVADFALCPTESIISYRTKSTPFDLIAIAAILQEDLSAITVRNDPNITRPKDLDGKTYASYHARYEDEIVRQLIINDGGVGNIQLHYPEKLGIWETIVNGKYDATWIFMNWEGVEATTQNIPLRYFKMQDYKVPYSYSPVIAASEQSIQARTEAYRKFLNATKRGYLYAKHHPKLATDILKPYIPKTDESIDLLLALEISAPAFGNESTWGKMKASTVENFLKW